MQDLKKKLQEMYGRPFRSVPGVFLVEFSDGPDCSFFVTFHYRAKTGEGKLFRKHYDKHYVFGTTCNNANQNEWTYRMRVCRFGQETISELLGAMGVL